MMDLDYQMFTSHFIVMVTLPTTSTIETHRTILFAEHYRMTWKYLFPQNIVEHLGKELCFQNMHRLSKSINMEGML